MNEISYIFMNTVEPLKSSSSHDPISIHLRDMARWTTWFDPPWCGRKRMRRDKMYTRASSENRTKTHVHLAVSRKWIETGSRDDELMRGSTVITYEGNHQHSHELDYDNFFFLKYKIKNECVE